MKKLVLLVTLVVGLVVSANAAMIDLGYTWGQPADPLSELSRLNSQIGLYNNLNNPDLPSAIGWTAEQTQTDGSLTSITLDLLGYDGYLMFKYGPIDRFFYVSGLDNYTFTSDVYNMNGGGLRSGMVAEGLSHYTEFHPVPETGTWISGFLLLFPFAASTLRIYRPSWFVN